MFSDHFTDEYMVFVARSIVSMLDIFLSWFSEITDLYGCKKKTHKSWQRWLRWGGSNRGSSRPARIEQRGERTRYGDL